MTSWLMLGTYVLGVALGFLWGSLWAAGYVYKRAGVIPCELKWQR